MNHSFRYFSPVVKTNTNPINLDSWQKVKEQYEKGAYKDAVRGVIEYANPKMYKKYGNKELTEFNLPHGSVMIIVKITEEELLITVPFLKVSEANSIPLYRQVAQLNFSPLNITKIVLEDGKLSFKYSCPLDTCEPYKIWDVLYETAIYADSHADKFIQLFGAERVMPPLVRPFSAEKRDQFHQGVLQILDEAFQYLKHFEEKRWEYFAWDCIASTLFKIDNYCFPQGYIKAELEKEIHYQISSNEALSVKISNGKSFLKKLQNWDAEGFKSYLYEVDTLIPSKKKANAESVKDILRGIYDRSKSELAKNDHIACTLSIQYVFYYLMYYNSIAEGYHHEIHNALRKAGGQPWNSSSRILFKAISNMMYDNLSASAVGKGLFSRLFGS